MFARSHFVNLFTKFTNKNQNISHSLGGALSTVHVPTQLLITPPETSVLLAPPDMKIEAKPLVLQANKTINKRMLRVGAAVALTTAFITPVVLASIGAGALNALQSVLVSVGGFLRIESNFEIELPLEFLK